MRCYLSLLFLLAFASLVTSQTVRTVTITPAGQGGTYNSLFAAEAAEDDTGDLVSRDEIVIFEIDGDWSGGPDTTAVTIDGWTTDATRYIEIRTTATARHDGKWNAAEYILSGALTINEDFVHIYGLQSLSVGSSGNPRNFVFSNTSGAVRSVNECIFKGELSGTANFAYGIFTGTAGTLTVRNCAFWNFVNGANTCSGIALSSGTETVNVLNCTVYGSLRGITVSGTPVCIAKNVLVQSATDGFVGTFDVSSSNNCSEIVSDAPGSSPQTGTVSFVNAAAGDFHLQSGDTVAKDNGADLSGTFTTDIDGQTRTGTWDIGVDEFVSTGTTKKDAGFFFP